jgi:DNA invertase Pin-like site-specific DNA recombinase
LLTTMLAAIAEFERELIRERIPWSMSTGQK